MKKTIMIDDDTIKFYKKIRLYRLLKLFGYSFKLKNPNKYKNKTEIKNIINILNTKKRRNMYSLIYDYACDELDKEFICNNLCDFKKDKCISNRNKRSKNRSCCENKNRDLCKHFNTKEKKCGIKSISCKLFVCSHLRKKGVSYNVNKIIYLKYFLSFRQKILCYTCFFEDKDEIINKFMKFYKWG